MNVEKHTPPPVETTYSLEGLTEDELTVLRNALFLAARSGSMFSDEYRTIARTQHKTVYAAMNGYEFLDGDYG